MGSTGLWFTFLSFLSFLLVFEIHNMKGVSLKAIHTQKKRNVNGWGHMNVKSQTEPEHAIYLYGPPQLSPP